MRHRVKNYRAGDLERRYPQLDIEEDVLYAYGFLPRENWRLLHPRSAAGLSSLERRVLEVVRKDGPLHPRELEQHLGRERLVNAWGGYSKATTHALQRLHYRGLLRVARRENGVRIYGPITRLEEHLPRDERRKRLTLLAASIFAPVPLASFREILRFLSRAAPDLRFRSAIIDTLLRTGELESAETDGLLYLWPAESFKASKPPADVRFLAPFDPLVWDRRRFEHLWGWRYRFEAYTPVQKRQLGYYAMPLLWIDRVIGWANVSLTKGQFSVGLGFVNKRPDSPAFEPALEGEIGRMRAFLKAAEEEPYLEADFTCDNA